MPTLEEIIANHWDEIAAPCPAQDYTAPLRRQRALSRAYAFAGANTPDDMHDVEEIVLDGLREDDINSGPYEWDTNAGGAYWYDEDELYPDIYGD